MNLVDNRMGGSHGNYHGKLVDQMVGDLNKVSHNPCVERQQLDTPTSFKILVIGENLL